jgi:hypothetical protein
VAQVHDYFTRHGIDAARALGVTLNLAPGTVKGWIAGWLREGGSPAPSTPSPGLPSGRARVVLSYDPEAVGVIVSRGEQVSEVRFADGHSRFIVNHFIKEVEK